MTSDFIFTSSCYLFEIFLMSRMSNFNYSVDVWGIAFKETGSLRSCLGFTSEKEGLVCLVYFQKEQSKEKVVLGSHCIGDAGAGKEWI